MLAGGMVGSLELGWLRYKTMLPTSCYQGHIFLKPVGSSASDKDFFRSDHIHTFWHNIAIIMIIKIDNPY